MASTDRIVRTALAVVIGVLVINGTLGPTPTWVLAVVSVLLLATAAFGFCPLYLPFAKRGNRQPVRPALPHEPVDKQP